MVNDKETILQMLRMAEDTVSSDNFLTLLLIALMAELELGTANCKGMADVYEKIVNLKNRLRRYQEEYGEIDE